MSYKSIEYYKNIERFSKSGCCLDICVIVMSGGESATPAIRFVIDIVA